MYRQEQKSSHVAVNILLPIFWTGIAVFQLNCDPESSVPIGIKLAIQKDNCMKEQAINRLDFFLIKKISTCAVTQKQATLDSSEVRWDENRLGEGEFFFMLFAYGKPYYACGDKVCDTQFGENCDSCPIDCGLCLPNCGDNNCEFNRQENAQNCFDDCGLSPRCGDFFCDLRLDETAVSCPADCTQGTCGDGICEFDKGETKASCQEDCGPSNSAIRCGDNKCDLKSGESCSSCPVDCRDCNNKVIDETPPSPLISCRTAGGVCIEANSPNSQSSCSEDFVVTEQWVCEPNEVCCIPSDPPQIPCNPRRYRSCPENLACVAESIEQEGNCLPPNAGLSYGVGYVCGGSIGMGCAKGLECIGLPTDPNVVGGTGTCAGMTFSCGNQICEADKGETCLTCSADCDCAKCIRCFSIVPANLREQQDYLLPLQLTDDCKVPATASNQYQVNITLPPPTCNE